MNIHMYIYIHLYIAHRICGGGGGLNGQFILCMATTCNSIAWRGQNLLKCDGGTPDVFVSTQGRVGLVWCSGVDGVFGIQGWRGVRRIGPS